METLSASQRHTLVELCAKVVRVSGDGNCLFRAVSYGLFGNPNYHKLLRDGATHFLDGNRPLFEYAFDSGISLSHGTEGHQTHYSNGFMVTRSTDSNSLTVTNAKGGRDSTTTAQPNGDTHIRDNVMTDIVIHNGGTSAKISDAEGVATTATVECTKEYIRIYVDHPDDTLTVNEQRITGQECNVTFELPHLSVGFKTVTVRADGQTMAVTFANAALTVTTTTRASGSTQSVVFADGSLHTIGRGPHGTVNMTHERSDATVVQPDTKPIRTTVPDKESTGTLEQYLRAQRKDGTFASEIIISALCQALGLDMTVVASKYTRHYEKGPLKVWVLYTNGNHYDAIVPQGTVFHRVPQVLDTSAWRPGLIISHPVADAKKRKAVSHPVAETKKPRTVDGTLVLHYHQKQDKGRKPYIRARRQRMHGQRLQHVLQHFIYKDEKGQDKPYRRCDWDYDYDKGKGCFTFVTQTTSV